MTDDGKTNDPGAPGTNDDFEVVAIGSAIVQHRRDVG